MAVMERPDNNRPPKTYYIVYLTGLSNKFNKSASIELLKAFCGLFESEALEAYKSVANGFDHPVYRIDNKGEAQDISNRLLANGMNTVVKME